MPFIPVDRIRSFIRRQLNILSSVAPLQTTACVECGAQPANTPCMGACGHTFCYYCAAARCQQDTMYACPQCNALVAPIQRLRI